VKLTASIRSLLLMQAVCVLLLAGPVFADARIPAGDELLIDARQNDVSYTLGGRTEWQALALDAVVPDEQSWQYRNRDLINLGFSRDAQWLRIRFQVIAQPESDVSWIFSLGTANARLVDFSHRLNGRELANRRSGTGVPFASRVIRYRQIAFPVPMVAGEHELLLRIESNSSLSVQPTLSTRTNWLARVLNHELVIGAYLGLLAILALYNLTVFVRVHEPVFGCFAMSLLGAVIWIMADTGVAPQLLYPTHPSVHDFVLRSFLGVFLAGLLLFSHQFLAVNRWSPVLARSMLVTAGCIGVAFLFPVFRHFPGISMMIVIGSLLMNIAATVIAVKRGVEGAAAYLGGLAVFAAGIIIVSGNTMEWRLMVTGRKTPYRLPSSASAFSVRLRFPAASPKPGPVRPWPSTKRRPRAVSSPT
jgi:hypothetical protein